MSNVILFNKNLFNRFSEMDLSNYEKEYFKKFNRTSKNINKYYNNYVKLYNSEDEEIVKSTNVMITTNNLENKNTSISSFFIEFNGFKTRQQPCDRYIPDEFVKFLKPIPE